MSNGSVGERLEEIHPVLQFTQDPPPLQAWDMENFPESTPDPGSRQQQFREFSHSTGPDPTEQVPFS
jgi:hypothetical protein